MSEPRPDPCHTPCSSDACLRRALRRSVTQVCGVNNTCNCVCGGRCAVPHIRLDQAGLRHRCRRLAGFLAPRRRQEVAPVRAPPRRPRAPAPQAAGAGRCQRGSPVRRGAWGSVTARTLPAAVWPGRREGRALYRPAAQPSRVAILRGLGLAWRRWRGLWVETGWRGCGNMPRCAEVAVFKSESGPGVARRIFRVYLCGVTCRTRASSGPRDGFCTEP